MASKKTRQILEPFLVGDPHPNGDYDARCPLHDDKTRSARINFKKNVWICFRGCGSGSLAGLLKQMREGGPGGSVRTRRKRRPTQRENSKVASVSEKLVQRWHEELLRRPHAMERLRLLRGLNDDTVVERKLGWDQTSQAFTIPIYLEDGTLFHVRKYRPDAPSDKKIWWHRRKDPAKEAPLYPLDVLAETEWVVLCAGEMDALIAGQYGFPAITGTAGESTWHVSWSEYFRDKTVFIAYDRDKTGEQGARLVAEHLEQVAREIYITKIPINRKGADVSDYFLMGREAEEFRHVLRKSKPFQKRVRDPMKMKPTQVSVMSSFDSQNVGRAQGMDVLISGRAREPYSLPKVVKSTCTQDAGKQCAVCPMLARDGEYTHEVPASSPQILSMMDSGSATMKEALRELVEAQKCNKLHHEVKTHQTVEQLYVRPSWDETSGEFTPRRINSVGKHDTMPSQVVHVTGTTWPDPSRQTNEFLAWAVDEAENAIDEFRVTPDIVREMKKFRPRGQQTPLKKLGMIAYDMEQHVTRIYGRLDLHMAIDLVFMSIASFPFQGKIERRGWLDALVVGDTRTGKSEAAQRLLEHYGMGQFVNCEAATFAGIIGGLQQMADRQWAITWGIVPMSDRRLVVLDEASGLTHEEIQKMSDVRSRGIIRMQKIQSEQAWARTRLIWLSNPRDESMDKYTYGIQAIPPLIGNREDIARFDFALALTGRDVDMDSIYQIPATTEVEYTSEDCRRRVLWAWSRTADDVFWDEGVEHDVLIGAEWLGEQYVSDPPLIQPANAHVKLARLAVAFASATFSTDSSGKHVIVRRAHVRDATRFLHYLYSKDTFGYHRMSERAQAQRDRAERYSDTAKTYLLENRFLIEFLKSAEGQFRREMVEQIVNVSREEANAIINNLFKYGLVSPNGSMVKLNPAMHSILREIEQEGY